MASRGNAGQQNTMPRQPPPSQQERRPIRKPPLSFYKKQMAMATPLVTPLLPWTPYTGVLVRPQPNGQLPPVHQLAKRGATQHAAASRHEPRDQNIPRHASHKRNARRSSGHELYCGTLNTRDLGTQDGLGRLTAISQLMQTNNVAVLAVQETKLEPHSDDVQQAGLRYFGSFATRSKSASIGRRQGGSGFLIQPEAAQYFTFLDMRPQCTHSSPSRKYATKWGHLYGATKEEDIWIGCVYLPDTSQPSDTYDKALADLAADITHFATKPGHIVLAGDFNARVGHRELTTVPAHLRDTAPAYGKTPSTPMGAGSYNSALRTDWLSCRVSDQGQQAQHA